MSKLPPPSEDTEARHLEHATSYYRVLCYLGSIKQCVNVWRSLTRDEPGDKPISTEHLERLQEEISYIRNNLKRLEASLNGVTNLSVKRPLV